MVVLRRAGDLLGTAYENWSLVDQRGRVEGDEGKNRVRAKINGRCIVRKYIMDATKWSEP